MLSSVQLTFEAIDSLMFRDGRPFNQSDEGVSVAASVFPPYPPTLVGAVRAALWAQLGGTNDDWDKKQLGDGTDWKNDDTLGDLSFGPPMLLLGKVPVFPVPLHVVEGKDARGIERITWLLPSSDKLSCDLGEVALPVPAPVSEKQLEDIKQITDRWLTLDGMEAVLRGELPDEVHFIRANALWGVEPRVGIGIDLKTRATIKSQLYMASHIRLKDNVSLGIEMSGWKNDVPDGMRPLAGEHRMVHLSIPTDGWHLPSTPDSSVRHYCVVLLSPLVLEALPKPAGRLGDLPGKIKSACLGKPVSIGGWDSQKGQPVPLRQAIPTGSVFFMELDDGETADWSACAKGIGVGKKWGFGHYLIGKCQGDFKK